MARADPVSAVLCFSILSAEKTRVNTPTLTPWNFMERVTVSMPGPGLVCSNTTFPVSVLTESDSTASSRVTAAPTACSSSREKFHSIRENVSSR